MGIGGTTISTDSIQTLANNTIGVSEAKVTIDEKEYNQLKKDAEWLRCLEAAGVDNWVGFDEAKAMMESDNG